MLDKGAAYITTDILAGNTNPKKNPFWGQFAIQDGGRRRPATLKTGTSNEARDLNAYGYIGAPDDKGRTDGEFALAVGAWNGNSDNSLVSKGAPLFSIEVTTYVWQGFLEEATKGWSINGFGAAPDTIDRASVDPWTGLAAGPARPVGRGAVHRRHPARRRAVARRPVRRGDPQQRRASRTSTPRGWRRTAAG